ncbi:MAG: quinone-dependent dihydroorotate dehydrogenase [Phaeodactylibacter sp.]|nr:quinone-dependent dihydroorotate dehydrogenase [Phaeodactylibacter sp.]MCB9048399.1 quinone-dependent dihydroorotate dehydrogenase [Lewinellaceae bacterium]
MYKILLKPFFFLFPPERAHHLTLFLFKLALAVPGFSHLFRALYRYEHPALRRELFGLTFANPIGLAAGFDKDGRHFRAMASLGFGFIEVGTVTPKGQEGNPLPRLFRLPQDEALINRMGFNNEGAGALVERLKQGKPQGLIVGGNIGKNKVTPNEEAEQDYARCFEALYPYVDYFAVNVSSPNTPGLRGLQDKEPLSRLLNLLQSLNRQKPTPRPILLKIAPDLTDGQLDDIIEIVESTGIDGVIATNTTIGREGLSTSAAEVERIGAGGLSGRPVKERSTEVIRYLKERSNNQLTIIGVGGIASPEDALEKIRAGASLVQVYTGLVYEGPGLVKRIKKALAEMP